MNLHPLVGKPRGGGWYRLLTHSGGGSRQGKPNLKQAGGGFRVLVCFGADYTVTFPAINVTKPSYALCINSIKVYIFSALLLLR